MSGRRKAFDTRRGETFSEVLNDYLAPEGLPG
jgi:hypothetical protein